MGPQFTNCGNTPGAAGIDTIIAASMGPQSGNCGNTIDTLIISRLIWTLQQSHSLKLRKFYVNSTIKTQMEGLQWGRSLQLRK